MSIIEKSIEVNVPEYTAYAQWTHFEEFPQFMEGVKEVKRLGPKRLRLESRDRGPGQRVGCGDHRGDRGPTSRVDESRWRHQGMGRGIS